MLRICLLIVFTASVVHSLDNGLGLKPILGYSSWYDTSSAVTEERIKNITSALISTGLAAKGYIHVNIDEGWLLKRDSKTNMIISDPQKFPSGMKAMGDWIHSQCLDPAKKTCMKYGLYTSRGTCQCSTSQYHGPGSQGFEKQDAQYFADAGADFLKEDSCCGSQDHDAAFADYARMRDALNATRRPIYFSLCGWKSWYAPTGKALGNSWRISGDGSHWSSLVTAMNVMAVVTQKFGGPGGWNDPDMLIATGKGSYGPGRNNWYLTEVQARAQFSLWSAMSAPLIIGANIGELSPYLLETYGNADVIAVNQDPGRPGFPRVWPPQGMRLTNENITETGGTMVWGKPLSNEMWAIVFFNNNNVTTNVVCDPGCMSLLGFVSGSLTVRDLWEGQTHGPISSRGPWVVPCDPNGGVRMYRVWQS